jgi:hypothetical protein
VFDERRCQKIGTCGSRELEEKGTRARGKQGRGKQVCWELGIEGELIELRHVENMGRMHACIFCLRGGLQGFLSIDKVVCLRSIVFVNSVLIALWTWN